MEIEGFEVGSVAVHGSRLHVAQGGAGPPVLLLHGFPETHLAWRHVATELARSRRVVAPDLPGYGASQGPLDPSGPEAWSKRATADTLVAMMGSLGHAEFAVVGVDRGALAAFRMALDDPATVTHLGVLAAVPSGDAWSAGADPAGAFPLSFLAQPADFPERMVGADPDTFFGHFLDTWPRVDGAVPPDVRAEYLGLCSQPAVVHGICQEHRAEVLVDVANDEADRAEGRSLAMPVLALWPEPPAQLFPVEPLDAWQSWAEDLRWGSLACGRFLPEELPAEVAFAIQELLDT